MLSPRHVPSLCLETLRSQSSWKAREGPKQGRVTSIMLHTSEMQEPRGWRHQGSQDAVAELLPPTSSYTSHPLLQHHRRSRPGGKAKNHSRRRADTEAGEPRALCLPHSPVTAARKPFGLTVPYADRKFKLSFTPDLQILRRRRKRDKKKPGHLLEGLAAEKKAAHGDSPGRALVRLSG